MMLIPLLPKQYFTLSLVLLLSLMPVGAWAQTWMPAPSFPDQTQGREHATGLNFQGNVIALGGSPYTANLDGLVHYLPLGASAWIEAAVVEGTIINHGVGVDALDRIIAFGGKAEIGDDEGKAYYYDLVEGKKGAIAARGAAAPLEHFAWATDDQNRIYSLGGGPGASATPADPNSTYVERYSALTDTWEVLTPMPTAVAGAQAVHDGAGHILIMGGFEVSGGTRTANVAQYDIATNTWSDLAVPDMPAALSGHAAVLGADGRVYVVGGNNGGAVLQSTWVFTVSTNTWTAGPDLAAPREECALALGSDDFIYAMGGHDGSQGLYDGEKLYTPPCPGFSLQPAPVSGWLGQGVTIMALTTGGTPLTFQWKMDGMSLVDGMTPGGSVILGSTTETLTLTGLTPMDEGSYELVATNPCGSATSDPAFLTVMEPPEIGTAVAVTNLHPPGSSQSSAYSASGVYTGGFATLPHPTYGAVSHPRIWSAVDGTVTDLTPANSVGGSVSAMDGDIQAGWYWWPYNTPHGVGYHKHACAWSGSAGTHVDIQLSGWEFGSVSDTHNGQYVGTLRFDESSTNSHAFLWNSPVKAALKLTPAGMWGSGASAVYDGCQFGSVHIGFGTVHAAMWSGSASSFVDLNPAGSTWSYILGAGLGQQVGRATFGGQHHAGLWGGSAESFIDLNPAGAPASEARDAEGGLQVGNASVGGKTVACLWAGSADSFLNLHDYLDSSFSYSSAYSVAIDEHGTITVAGTGYNTATARLEALRWRFNSQLLSGDVTNISALSGGTQLLHLFAGPEHGGQEYFILGSFSGSTPGLQVNPWIHLPLNYDFYFLYTANNPNSAVHTNSKGFLDNEGTAWASFNPPPGLVLPAPVTLNHAFVILDSAMIITQASNAVPITLDP